MDKKNRSGMKKMPVPVLRKAGVTPEREKTAVKKDVILFQHKNALRRNLKKTKAGGFQRVKGYHFPEPATPDTVVSRAPLPAGEVKLQLFRTKLIIITHNTIKQSINFI